MVTGQIWEKCQVLEDLIASFSSSLENAVKVANVDDEESSDGGDEDQASPSRRCSQGEFRSTSCF